MKAKIITTLLAIALGIIIPVFGNAQDLISVQFVPDPLIYAENFLPGDTVSGQIKVDNVSGQAVNIYVWTSDVSDTNHLGNALTLKLSKDQNIIYQSTLSQFFEQDSVFLSSIEAGKSENFEFSLQFDINAGNEYQNKELGFTLHIGTEENQEEGGDSGSGGGSTPIIIGGGGVSTPTLEIINLRAEEIAETSAKIKWQTNLPATTQIVYSQENQPHYFLPNYPPLYGYQNLFPDPENSAKVISRTLSLKNLSPCTTYFYRAISHNSSLAISEEKSFKTICVPGGGSTSEESTLPEESTEPSEAPQKEIETSTETEINQEREEAATPLPSQPAPSLPQPSNQTSLQPAESFPIKISQGGKNRIQPGFLSSILASINNALNLKGFGCSPWWAVLLLILYSLFKSGVSFYRSQKQSKENNDFLKIKYRKHAAIWLVWAAILFLVMLVMMKICINLLVLALLVLVTLLLFLRLKEEKSKRKTYQKATQSYPQFVKS